MYGVAETKQKKNEQGKSFSNLNETKNKKQKTKQKQISKIEETNILIENPKTQNKNE